MTTTVSYTTEWDTIHATLRLMERLDQIVLRAGGRLYVAKDGRMPARVFLAGYPMAPEFMKHVDPGMSSAFWDHIKND